MSSNIHNLPNPFNADIDGDIRVAIISAEWNSHITDALTRHCDAIICDGCHRD